MKNSIITVKGKPREALINAEEIESLEETAEILSIPGAKRSIKAGLREAKAGQGMNLFDLMKIKSYSRFLK